ncbi:hypothetical protein D3C71_1858060 [compost metagenome]
MNGFIVNLHITDVCCDKCFREVLKKNITITDTNQTVALQDCYFLNVINVTDNYCTVLIQNGVYAIIRNIATNYDMQICIPYKCGEHVVTIGCEIMPV